MLRLNHGTDAGDVPEGANQRVGDVFGWHVDATGVVDQVHRGALAIGGKMKGVRHGLGVGLESGFFHVADSDLGRVAEVERTHRHIERVAAKVANGTIAEVVPAAPLGRMIDAVFVRTHRRRAAPEIPVHSVRHRILAGRAHAAIGPAVSRVPDVHVGYLPKQPGLNQFDAPAKIRRGAALVAGLGDDARRAGQFPQRTRLGDRVSQRLFAVHVPAGLHCRRADRRVPVVRRGDHHGVDRFLLLEQFTVVGIGFDIPGLGLVPVLGTSDLVGINVTKRHDVVPELQSVVDVALYLATHADESDVEPVVGPENSARENGRRGNGSGDKSSAFHESCVCLWINWSHPFCHSEPGLES